MPAPKDGVLLIATPQRVTAIDAGGTRWRTRRLAIDGIVLDRIEPGRMVGTADPGDGPNARSFSVDLLSGDAEGGYVEPAPERAARPGNFRRPC